VSLAILVATILVPYFVAFHTNGLWVKEMTELQQPTVHFKHIALLAVEGSAVGSDLRWSTEAAVNDLYGDSLRVAEVSSFENDVDRDGKPDMVEVTLSMPLEKGEQIQHASAMLFFDYELSDTVAVDMEGVVFVDGSSPISGQSMWVAGDMRLRQLKPIRYRSTVDTYSSSVLNTNSPQLEDVQFTSMLGAYSMRNLTTYVGNEQQVWTPGPGGSADAMLSFTMTVQLRIPEELVRYQPGFWEMIKYGWVQYLSIFLVVKYLLSLLEAFIYDNSVVQTTVTYAQTSTRKPKF
jgi:transmembrane protein 231